MGTALFRGFAVGTLSAGLVFSGPAFARPPGGDVPKATAVEASPSEAEARKLQDQADRAMLDMRYVDALALYERAQALEPNDVGLDYSIARAHQMVGEFPEALSALERFERHASADQKAMVGRLQQLFTDLRSRVAVLHLRCNQAGARVLVRDKVIGTTPLPSSTRLSAGVATIQVELEGFFSAKQDVVLPGGGTLDLELKLNARSRSALLMVRTQPTGAVVLVDGLVIGTSSPRTELVVSAGSHQVMARREGYEDASVPLVLSAGSTRQITVSLERSTPLSHRWWFWGGVAVVAIAGAAVSVALLTERAPDQGSLSPGRVAAPLGLPF